jgi:excisionase family DNA binding protein
MTSSADFEPLLDVQQAAALLRMHPKTVARLARAGMVPAYRVARYWRFRSTELDAFVRATLSSGCDHSRR